MINWGNFTDCYFDCRQRYLVLPFKHDNFEKFDTSSEYLIEHLANLQWQPQHSTNFLSFSVSPCPRQHSSILNCSCKPLPYSNTFDSLYNCICTYYVQFHMGNGCRSPIKVGSTSVFSGIGPLDVVYNQSGWFEVAAEKCTASEDFFF